MDFFNKCFNEIGIKKLALFFHYFLAIISSLTFFAMCFVCTFLPQTIDITELKEIYIIIMIYCAIIIAYITIICIFEKLQTMNKKNSKFDFIAFFIGFSMFVTLGLIIVCIVFMFFKTLTDIEFQMWKTLIQIFGGIFMTEAGGGYIYNIAKKCFKSKADDGANKELNESETLGST